jgi:hypothetical protein
MAFTLDAGLLVNNVGDAIAFADGFGRTFGYTGAASNTIFSNFHRHDVYSICELSNIRYTPRFGMSNDNYLAFGRFCNKSR